MYRSKIHIVVSEKKDFRIYNQFVKPVMIYGCETWKLTRQTENLLRIAQRAMERAMLGITLRDRKRSNWIREKTRVKNIIWLI